MKIEKQNKMLVIDGCGNLTLSRYPSAIEVGEGVTDVRVQNFRVYGLSEGTRFKFKLHVLWVAFKYIFNL